MKKLVLTAERIEYTWARPAWRALRTSASAYLSALDDLVAAVLGTKSRS
jgi:hypothetical protein